MSWQSYIQWRVNTSLESLAMQTMLFPHIFLYKTLLEKPRTFGTMKLEAMFHCFQKSNLIFSLWRAIGMVTESGCQA